MYGAEVQEERGVAGDLILNCRLESSELAARSVVALRVCDLDHAGRGRGRTERLDAGIRGVQLGRECSGEIFVGGDEFSGFLRWVFQCAEALRGFDDICRPRPRGRVLLHRIHTRKPGGPGCPFPTSVSMGARLAPPRAARARNGRPRPGAAEVDRSRRRESTAGRGGRSIMSRTRTRAVTRWRMERNSHNGTPDDPRRRKGEAKNQRCSRQG